MAETDAASKAARPYHAPRRDEQARRTRARIVAAAAEQFRIRGYAATTVRAVAAVAGVAVPTVELAFGTKARLLKAVIDEATAGDDEPVAMLERDWAGAATRSETVEDFLVIIGRVVRETAERVADLVVVATEAASTDPEIDALCQTVDVQRALNAGWIVDGIAARSALRNTGTDTAVDTVWLLMDPAVYCRLIHRRGWSAARFERWFVDSVHRLVANTEPPDRAQ